MLTVSEAWAAIAAAYEKKIATGERAPDGDDTAFYGFCYATSHLYFNGQITREQRDEMREQIEGALEDRHPRDMYLAPYCIEGDRLRSSLATLFSEITK